MKWATKPWGEFKPTRKQVILFWVSLAGVTVGVCLSQLRRAQSDATIEPTPARIILPPKPEEVAAAHLNSADRACEAIIEEHVAAIEAFFQQARSNTEAFAKASLGWGSKWRLVSDHLPLAEGGQHERYIREQFEAYVFSREEMEQAVTGLIRNYLAQVQSIENRMLVGLRADVADLGDVYAIAGLDDTQLREAFDQAISQAIASAAGSLPGDIGVQLVSIIGGEVLTQVATRMGISAGILGTGAASSSVTFGVGLVVGVIVDYMVAWVWDWWADPTGELADAMNAKLDAMQKEMEDSLRSRLNTFASERSMLRQSTVLALLQPQR
jgi:hypothetical protein